MYFQLLETFVEKMMFLSRAESAFTALDWCAQLQSAWGKVSLSALVRKITMVIANAPMKNVIQLQSLFITLLAPINVIRHTFTVYRVTQNLTIFSIEKR